ncbi:hypothetical protein HII36_07660 [Nonomuraea sp. NN258]|uniref:Bug family tripartite tricarboxylate transporter substrate binding protein n=1 Tax=Nonomuraea antri TaxID=2730852 RepID=UPI001567C782|nr:tripartite tricarboxylate transporter substrate-binding protein [Nonomuraea antri]NRQ31718.1 hypothetical protein [Nonomuraea antri]
MRRRRFLTLGFGLAVCAAGAGGVAGCGTERAPGSPAGLGAAFTLRPPGRRWARVGQAFVAAARENGFDVTAADRGTPGGTPGSAPGGGSIAGGPGGRPPGGASGDGRAADGGEDRLEEDPQAGDRSAGTRISITGLPALAAAELNNGRTLLDLATPLARLVGEIAVVVVPATSRFRGFDDFGAHLIAQPERTLLAGGPHGDPDHLLFGLIAKGLGADTRQVDYTGYPSSHEAVPALLAGKAAAGVGSLSDWLAHIRSGRVRALAVSSANRVPGLDVPTLLESGVRVDFANWCAAVGPDHLPDDRRDTAVRLCDEVTGSDTWQAACRANGWASMPLSGEDFTLWLTGEVERTREVLRDLGLLRHG